MQQVILNIIANAVDAMKDSEYKILGVKTAQCTQPGHISLTISDTGSGIAEEDMRRIFDPFFTKKDIGQGTGLGLSICYGIIEDHHGKVWAENNATGGASFFIELPLPRE